MSISPAHSPQLTFSPPPQDDDDDDGDGNGDPHGDDDAHTIPQDSDPWEDYNNDPDPHNNPDLYPSRPSPPDDNIGFAQLINRAAQ